MNYELSNYELIAGFTQVGNLSATQVKIITFLNDMTSINIVDYHYWTLDIGELGNSVLDKPLFIK